MEDEFDGVAANIELTAEIVAAFVRHNTLPSDKISSLIGEVNAALVAASRGQVKEAEPVPAVPVKQSVKEDYLICLECGSKQRTLKRHLGVKHGMDEKAYRTRWRLLPDYPLVAPSYAKKRSALAVKMGLGRRSRRSRGA